MEKDVDDGREGGFHVGSLFISMSGMVEACCGREYDVHDGKLSELWLG